MRTHIPRCTLAAMIFAGAIALGLTGCGDSGDQPGNLLADPSGTQGGKVDDRILDDSVFVQLDTNALNPMLVSFQDSTVGTAVPPPPPNHTDNGPDRTRFVIPVHVTAGADKSRYFINVHNTGLWDQSTYTKMLYEHITTGFDKSYYKPKGSTHVVAGPDRSMYRGGTPAPNGNP